MQKPLKLNPDVVPATVRAAVEQVVAAIKTDGLLNWEVQNGLDLTRRGVPIDILYEWSLNDTDSPLRRDAETTYGILHRFDVVDLITWWAESIIAGENFDLAAACKIYHEHPVTDE